MLAADDGARVIAGGQTLVPLMAMRLARPTRLIDIARIPGLAYVRDQGKEIAIGAIEPKFYAELLERIGCAAHFARDQNDPATWSRRSEQLAAIFATRTRDEWCALLEGSDACFAPVLTLQESFTHPHIKARELYTHRDGYHHAAPAPRFSRTPGAIDPPPPAEALLRRWLG